MNATNDHEDQAETLAATSLVRAGRVYRQMLHFPELLADMREIFLAALEKRGVVSAAELLHRARVVAEADSSPVDPAVIQEYCDALIGLYLAEIFSDQEVEDHVNFARKKEKFRRLNRVVNTEGVTSIAIKEALKEFTSMPEGDLILSPSEAMGVRVALINHFISNQLPFVSIAKSYITIRDIDEMLDNSYWNRRRPGRIGGKAAGMFLAYKITVPRFGDTDPDIKKYVTIPESYYLNSGIFSDFVDHNNLDRYYSQKYKSREEIEEDYRHVETVFKKAEFPPDVVDDCQKFLQRVGEHPLIVRSSTLLEDNFGHAFSGKYDSVFLPNQGNLERRLREFLWGLCRVHMSLLGPAPILYRRDHNLLDFDERMAVLVQKVVGRRHGDYFLPFAAGVAYSHNAYRWSPRIRKEDGFLRLVLGLGTRAVDRVGTDYPRLVPLSHPLLRPEIDAAAITRYSQKMVDALNLDTGQLESLPWAAFLEHFSPKELASALSVNQDGHLAAPVSFGQPIAANQGCITFDRLLRNPPFITVMRKVLHALHEAYGGPVDVEFAWEDDQFYLLQCRPFAIREFKGKVHIPADLPPERILFTTSQYGANRVVRDIEYIVYVDPKAYGALSSQAEKHRVGKVVSGINHALQDSRFALFGPGRWGSNDINLGVRVSYEDINRTQILGEVAFQAGGSTPDVSCGTHFFNDLVEADIVPLAIYPDEPDAIFQEDFLLNAPNQLDRVCPEFGEYREVVHVIHVPAVRDRRLLQVFIDEEEGRGMGFLARSEEVEGDQGLRRETTGSHGGRGGRTESGY